MAIQVAVTSFRYNTLGDTVNFTDSGGATFIPDYIYLINGSCLNNTLYSNGTGAFNTWSINHNLTETATRKSAGQAAGEDPQFFAKICSGAIGQGLNAALNSFESDIFFGGNVYRSCQITAVGNGFFTYSVIADANFFTTDVIALCIKGISMEPISVGVAGSYATSFDPKGVWHPRLPPWSNAATGLSTGAGGANIGWGWDSPNGTGPNSAQILVENQDGNYRFVTTASYNGGINSIGPTTSIAGTVTEWGTNQLTVTAGTTSLYVIGGDNVLTASGSFDLNTFPGQQTFDTIIWAKALLTVTVGTDTEDSLLSDYGEICLGFTNGLTAASHWYGESTNGNVLPLQGACYISNDSLIRAVDSGGVQSASTTFGVQAAIQSLSDTGIGTINITAADGKARKVYWFAIGQQAVPPTPPVEPIPGCVATLPN